MAAAARRRILRSIVSGIAAFGVVATIVPGALGVNDASGVRNARVLVTSDFSTGSEGWAGFRSRLQLVAAGRHGRALRVAPLSSSHRFFAFRAPRPIEATERGATYTVRAWVRAPRSGGRVCLRVQHVAAGKLLRVKRRCVQAGARWQLTGPVRLTAGCSGGQLGVALVSSRGRTFDLDSVALTGRATAGTPTARVCARPNRTGKPKPPKPLPPKPSEPPPTEPTQPPSEPAPTEPAPLVPPVSSPGLPRSFLNPFPTGSIWNTPLPAQPAVDPESSAKIDYWLTQIRYPNMVLRAYATAIAVATPDSPVHSITCTVYACPNMNQYGPVPIPAGTRPDPSSDGHLAVWDPATNRGWDFWISQCPTSCGSAASGGSFTTDTLTPNVPYGANAAGVPLLAGIVHPEEIRAGHVPHPLVFATPNVGKGYVCPASHDDGRNLDAHALKEGTLLQLDPSLDVSALAIPDWQKTLARAMQQYGMYLVDGGGTLSVGAENPINRGDLWGELGLVGNSALFSSGFPWRRMRVLSPPAPWCG